MPLLNAAGNRTLGRGEIWLAKLIPGTKDHKGLRYIGGTQAFAWNTTSTTLEHYDMDHGQKELDDEAYLQTTRTGTFAADNINYDNLSLLALGTKAEITQVATAVVAEHIDAVEQGMHYQLGIANPASPLWPSGVRDLSAIGAVTNDAGTPVAYTVTTDWIVNLGRGTIYIVPGGAIVDGTNLRVGYTPTASSRAQIISGSVGIEVALKFVPFNQVGEQIDYFMPWCKLTPDGDFALKGDTWQTINFKISILKAPDRAAVYINGAPFLGP